MTLLYVASVRIDDSSRVYLELPRALVEKYPHICNDFYLDGFKALWLKVYSEKGRIISEPYKTIELKKSQCYVNRNYVKCIEITDLVKNKGIGKDYVLELHLQSFLRKESEGKVEEIPIFPGELRTEITYSVPSSIREKVEADIRLHEEISAETEAIDLLKNAGLEKPAKDLEKGLIKYRSQDWEASISEFRKVIEALKRKIDNKEVNFDNIEKRWEIMKSIIHNTYSLLSNFGQHAGTQGRRPEAKLAKELTTALVHYITHYITTKTQERER